MKITRIFLDLDDVLNVFTPAALEHVGCSSGPYDPEWGFDIIKAANETHPNTIFSPETFWWRFKRDFWANCEKSSMCDWLIVMCAERVGLANVHILTSPTEDPGCLAGKLEWIHRNLPKWLHRQFLMGPQKYLCARPGSLLIDDCGKNVMDFRVHGGRAILVPRPWNFNHNTAEQADNHVHDALEKMLK